MKPLCLSFASLAVVVSAHAQTAIPYQDDRSTPEALVRSLYNAINRKEYARAYAYFAVPPADDLDTYEQGFEGTERVDLLVGDPVFVEADGVRTFHLPAAIEAKQEDGSKRIFSGCYAISRNADARNLRAAADPVDTLFGERGGISPRCGAREL